MSSNKNEYLFEAANNGDVTLVGKLLQNGGVDAKVASDDEMTALMYAVRARSSDCVKLLLPVSDVNARNLDGDTALMLAVEDSDYHGEGSLELVKLLAPVSDANITNTTGLTALMAAINQEQIELVDALLPYSDLSKGIPDGNLVSALMNVNATGMTALDFARELGLDAVVSRIVSHIEADVLKIYTNDAKQGEKKWKAL